MFVTLIRSLVGQAVGVWPLITSPFFGAENLQMSPPTLGGADKTISLIHCPGVASPQLRPIWRTGPSFTPVISGERCLVVSHRGRFWAHTCRISDTIE